MDEQRSAPVFVEVKSLVSKFASDFFAGGVASGFTKSAMAPMERYVHMYTFVAVVLGYFPHLQH